MANTKISALTLDTAPARTADSLPTYDASAVATKRILLSDAGIYPVTAYLGAALAPADATTYYFSMHPAAGLATTAANHKIRILRTGVLSAVYLEALVATTLGSAETSTVSFRYNDTTDTTIVSTFALNATVNSFSNTGLSVAVTAGAYFTIKWVTPTWVTNPTGVTINAQLLFS